MICLGQWRRYTHLSPYIKDGKEPKNLFDYQARMLAQVGKVNRETAQIIIDSLGGADEVLRENLESAIMDALKSEDPVLQKAAEQGFLMGGGMVPPDLAPNQTRAFQAYYRQSADKLNLVNTVMLESTQAAYTATVADVTNKINRTQSIMNVASGEGVSGVSSLNEAVRDAVDKMVKNGITGFVDHGGHRWSPEAYVAMDTRTTLANTARAAVWEEDDRFGVDMYQVSHHDGARPLCYPWQGKVISRNGFTGTVKDGDGNTITVHSQDEIESFNYGGGLFGVNCGHYPISFIPGFSRSRPPEQNEEENRKEYEASQQQRGLERKLREERRDLAVLKAQGAPQDMINAQSEKVKQANHELDSFCDETGRARRKSREGTPIKASFPDPDTYTKEDFPTEQRDRVTDFFRGQTGQAETGNTVKRQDIGTLQMYDEAVGWAQESFDSDMEYLRDGWQNVDSQIKAFDAFEKEVPQYEKTLKDAAKREEFAHRTNSSDVINILQDGRMKSQIETGTSHGYLDIDKRKRATSQLFAGSEPISVSDSEYEIYGYLGNAPRANMYGNTRIVFKKRNLFDRTTLTVGDSLELIETGADPMATLAGDPKFVSYGRVFSDSIPNAPQRLEDVRRDFESIEKNGYLSDGGYIELQFHGGVTTEDIEYIEMSRSDANADKIEKLAEMRGVKIKWRK